MTNEIKQELNNKKLNIKEKSKLYKKISLLIKEPEKQSENDIQSFLGSIIDDNCIFMIVAKSQEMKEILKSFASEKRNKEVPNNLNYFSINNNEEIKAMYNTKCFYKIINIFNCFDYESFSIKIKKDYPATIENKHLKIVLAPRIEY